MAHSDSQNSNARKAQQQSNNNTTNQAKMTTPMIVERVNKIGYTQYDRLKKSNVTIGDVMSQAEGWAVYVWERVKPIVEKLQPLVVKLQPIVDRFQDPIMRADKLACTTLDLVEERLARVEPRK